MNDDLISRRAALDALDGKIEITGPTNSVAVKGYLRLVIDRLERLPSAEPEIIRCKDCKWWGYDDDNEVVRVCHAAKHGHMSRNWSIMIYRTHKGDFYCADAERREASYEL